jgi:hypothetical protein
MVSVGKLNTIFLNLIGSRSTKETVSLRFNADDSKTYEMDLHAGCVGLLITALMSELAKTAPDQVQPIRITSVQAGEQDHFPILVLGMEGGGTLPLKLEYGDIGKLIELLRNMSATRGAAH